MKSLEKFNSFANVSKVITILGALVTLTLFFFYFVEMNAYSLTGFQIAFGSRQTVAGTSFSTYKSAWYAFAFILSALTVVFAGVSFKKSGAKYATFGFSIATLINLLVLFLANPLTLRFDQRVTSAALAEGLEIVGTADAFLFAVISAGVVVALSIITVLVMDYAEVLASSGAKVVVVRRIRRFLRDYKREIKNVVWPSRKTVVKNTIAVLVMCALVGAYIWALDFGFSQLFTLILNLATGNGGNGGNG